MTLNALALFVERSMTIRLSQDLGTLSAEIITTPDLLTFMGR